MMPLGLGELADSRRQLERPGEVVRREDPPQSLDAVELDELPVGDLRAERRDLGLGRLRCVAAAGDARLLRQSLHRAPASLAPAYGGGGWRLSGGRG